MEEFQIEKATAEELIRYADLHRKCYRRRLLRHIISEELQAAEGSFNHYLAFIRGIKENKDMVRADLSGAILGEANLNRADLREVNFRGAKLGNAKLQRTRLERADLYEADLRWADLSEANLKKAYLASSDLRGAYLWKTDMRWANMKGVNLERACLQHAYLRWANLEGANMRNTVLVDIRNVPALSEEQVYQATMGHETLAPALVTNTTLSLIHLDIDELYKHAPPKTQEMLKKAFPRLQWDKSVAEQLQAAQEVFKDIQAALIISKGSLSEQGKMPLGARYPDVPPCYDIRHQIAMCLAVSAGLSISQAYSLTHYAAGMEPGRPALDKDSILRHVLAEKDVPKLRKSHVKANKKQVAISFKEKFDESGLAHHGPTQWAEGFNCKQWAAYSFKERFTKSALAKEGPKNWVEKASHTRQAEWASSAG